MAMLEVTATQTACNRDLPASLDRAESLIRDAVSKGAQLMPARESFRVPYFRLEQGGRHSALASEQTFEWPAFRIDLQIIAREA